MEKNIVFFLGIYRIATGNMMEHCKLYMNTVMYNLKPGVLVLEKIISTWCSLNPPYNAGNSESIN